jgi:hypothetical protein
VEKAKDPRWKLANAKTSILATDLGKLSVVPGYTGWCFDGYIGTGSAEFRRVLELGNEPIEPWPIFRLPILGVNPEILEVLSRDQLILLLQYMASPHDSAEIHITLNESTK